MDGRCGRDVCVPGVVDARRRCCIVSVVDGVKVKVSVLEVRCEERAKVDNWYDSHASKSIISGCEGPLVGGSQPSISENTVRRTTSRPFIGSNPARKLLVPPV